MLRDLLPQEDDLVQMRIVKHYKWGRGLKNMVQAKESAMNEPKRVLSESEKRGRRRRGVRRRLRARELTMLRAAKKKSEWRGKSMNTCVARKGQSRTYRVEQKHQHFMLGIIVMDNSIWLKS